MLTISTTFQKVYNIERIIVVARVPTGVGQLWNVMEIENAIFQDLQSFGKCNLPGPAKFWKREDFQNGLGKVLDLCLEQS